MTLPSQSYSGPSRATIAVVWALRILIGGVFIVSGIAKAIDIWGGAYKIEEYFLVWNISLPRSLFMILALALSASEFLLGAMLLLGAYRRTCVWALLAFMAVMLALTAYIFIANPVADCGCFGDMFLLSNGATFLKNIFLTLALVVLAFKNHLVKPVFNPYAQWVAAVLCLVYIVGIALWGYNIQPLVDFRSFPVGEPLVVDDEALPDVEFRFVYGKDGVEREFTAENLPDSTWTFVERKLVSGEMETGTDLVIYDKGVDVTEEALSADGPLLLVVIPDFRRASISFTYTINELQKAVEEIGGSMVEIAAMPDTLIDRWSDLSMAEYPIYTAEPTVLKELARGTVAAVFLRDGVIQWKRTLQSIDPELVVGASDKEAAFNALSFNGPRLLWSWTALLLASLGCVWLFCGLLSFLKRPGQPHQNLADSSNSNKYS